MNDTGVEVNPHDLRKAIEILDDAGDYGDVAILRLVRDATIASYNEARSVIGNEYSKQGLFYKAIQMAGPTKQHLVGEVGSAAKNPTTGFKYPLALEEGTKGPYLITATYAKALRWFDKGTGEAIFAKQVTHPGIKPRWIFRRVKEAIVKRLPDMARNIIRRINRGDLS